MADKFAPSFVAAKLYEKTSKNGNAYLVGRLGGVRLTVMKSRETSEDGAAIYSLMFSEAQPYQPPSNGTQRNKQRPLTRRRTEDEPGSDLDIDQSVPF